MKEYPILFSTEMVRAILEGRKTVTRRIIEFKPREEGLNLSFSGLEGGCYFTDKPEHGWVLRSRGAGGTWNDRTWPLMCPYGNIGDTLWVRETWCLGRASMEKRTDVPMAPPQRGGARSPVIYRAQPLLHPEEYTWKPSIFMPRWACRILLTVKNVKVERLWDITEEEAKAEGVSIDERDGTPKSHGYRSSYADLWDKINGKRKGGKYAWAKNCWVWAVTFERKQEGRVGENN